MELLSLLHPDHPPSAHGQLIRNNGSDQAVAPKQMQQSNTHRSPTTKFEDLVGSLLHKGALELIHPIIRDADEPKSISQTKGRQKLLALCEETFAPKLGKDLPKPTAEPEIWLQACVTVLYRRLSVRYEYVPLDEAARRYEAPIKMLDIWSRDQADLLCKAMTQTVEREADGRWATLAAELERGRVPAQLLGCTPKDKIEITRLAARELNAEGRITPGVYEYFTNANLAAKRDRSSTRVHERPQAQTSRAQDKLQPIERCLAEAISEVWKIQAPGGWATISRHLRDRHFAIEPTGSGTEDAEFRRLRLMSLAPMKHGAVKFEAYVFVNGSASNTAVVGQLLTNGKLAPSIHNHLRILNFWTTKQIEDLLAAVHALVIRVSPVAGKEFASI